MGAHVEVPLVPEDLQYKLSSSKQTPVGHSGVVSRSETQSSPCSQVDAHRSPFLPCGGVWHVPEAVATFTSPVHTHSTASPVFLHSPDPDVMGTPPTPQAAPSAWVPANTPLLAVSRGMKIHVVAVSLWPVMNAAIAVLSRAPTPMLT